MPYKLPNAERLLEKAMDKINESGKVKERDKPRLEQILKDVFINEKTPKEAIGLSARELECMYSYGYNLFTHGKFVEARLMMQYLMAIDPEDPRYPLACGAAFQQLKDYEMATSFYLLAFHLDQEDPVPLFYMYECFKRLNEPRSAYMMLENIIHRAADKPQHAVLVERAKRLRDTLYQEIVAEELAQGSKEEKKQGAV